MTVMLEDLSNLDRDALIEHIVTSYEAQREDVEPYEFIVAYESVGSWGCDSSSFFLMRKDGKLYENSGSHCSCYGFEGQWVPEETTVEAINKRGWISIGGYDSSPEENRKAIQDAINSAA